MSIAISDDAGRIVYLQRPDPAHVLRVAAAIQHRMIAPADLPAYGSNRWTSNNADWILSRWLTGDWTHPRTGAPGLNIAAALQARNTYALVILIESYLASVDYPDGTRLAYEVACCNGSSVVPDEMMPCGIWAKDPAATAHDYLFDLHHGDEADCFGREWSFDDANDAYCDIYAAAGFPIIARTRRLGLALFGGRVWKARESTSGLSSRRTIKSL